VSTEGLISPSHSVCQFDDVLCRDFIHHFRASKIVAEVTSGFSLKGLLLREVAGGQLNRSHIWAGGATLLYVSDRLSQAPTTIPRKVGNSRGRGAARTGCAMEVYGVTGGKEIVEFADAGGEFLLEVHGVKVADGNSLNLDSMGLVMIVEGLPVYVPVCFIVFGLEVEDGGDVGGFESVNVFRGFGEGADIEIFEDLGVVHAVSLVCGLGSMVV